MSCKEITSWKRSKEKKKEKEPPLLRERSNINKTGVGRRPGRTLSFVCFGRSSLLPSSILAVTVHSVLWKRQTLCYMQKLHVQQFSRFFQLDQHCSFDRLVLYFLIDPQLVIQHHNHHLSTLYFTERERDAVNLSIHCAQDTSTLLLPYEWLCHCLGHLVAGRLSLFYLFFPLAFS